MRALIWITGLLVLLWGGYWAVGSRSVKAAAEGWFAEQTTRGLEASYDDLAVQGFPNRFDLTVTGLALRDPATGTGWQAPFAQVFAMSWKPWHLIAALPNAQTITLPDQSLQLNSARLMGSLLLIPGPDLALNEIVAEGEALQLVSTAGWQMAAEKLVLSSRRDETRQNAHRLGLSVRGLVLDAGFAAAAGLTGRLEDIHLDATAQFSVPLDRQIADTRPRLLALEVTEARLLWGGFKISAKGEWVRDATGFASGEIAIRIEDWQSLPRVLAALGVIAPDFAPTLTKGLEVIAQSGPDPEVLTLPLKARDGRMSLGPFPLGPAPDWN